MDTRPRVKRKLIFKGNRITVIRDSVRINGVIRFRDWTKKPRVSAIVAVNKKDNILLVRQYRHGVNQNLWEIPAGTVDSSEAPHVCARRECEEETGYKPLKLNSLGSFVTAPAGSDAQVFLYLATDLKEGKLQPDEDEKLTVKAFTKQRIKQMLKSGSIKDAKSIIALYRYFSS